MTLQQVVGRNDAVVFRKVVDDIIDILAIIVLLGKGIEDGSAFQVHCLINHLVKVVLFHFPAMSGKKCGNLIHIKA